MWTPAVSRGSRCRAARCSPPGRTPRASRPSGSSRPGPARRRSRSPSAPRSSGCPCGPHGRSPRAACRGSPAELMRFGRTVGLAAAISIAAAAPAHAAKVEHVSKLGRTSYFAFVEKAGAARAQPKTSARTVAKLKLKSPEKTDDLVLVLDRTIVDDQEWLRVRLPVKPNGTTGWVKASSLSELQPVQTWLRISTKTFKATLIKNGKRVFS